MKFSLFNGSLFRKFLPSKEGTRLLQEAQKALDLGDFKKAKMITEKISFGDKSHKIVHGFIASIDHYEQKAADREEILKKYNLPNK